MDNDPEVYDVMRDLVLQTLASFIGRKPETASPAQKKFMHGFHFEEVDEEIDALR